VSEYVENFVLLAIIFTLIPIIGVPSQGADLAVDKVVPEDSVVSGEKLSVTTVIKNLGPTRASSTSYYMDGKMVDR